MTSPKHRSACKLFWRRGSAMLVVLLLMMAVTGMGILTIIQGRSEIEFGMVNTDMQRALGIADACAAGALKTLPMLLEFYLAQVDESGNFPPIIPQQFDANFFGDEPFGLSNRSATCLVTILDIADDAPAPGYSEGAGCFKRITLRAEARLERLSPLGESADVLQQQSATVRSVIIRGLFGPVTCN